MFSIHKRALSFLRELCSSQNVSEILSCVLRRCNCDLLITVTVTTDLDCDLFLIPPRFEIEAYGPKLKFSILIRVCFAA